MRMNYLVEQVLKKDITRCNMKEELISLAEAEPCMGSGASDSKDKKY